MRLLNAFILGLISVSLTFEGVNAKCEILTLSPPPRLITQLGSKQWVSDPGRSLIRDNYESVNLYCENGFIFDVSAYSHYHYTDDKYSKISCNDDKFWLMIDSKAEGVEAVYCQGTETSSMFESRTSMTDCEGYMSLVVGQASEEYGSLKSAAICYDIDKQQLKYIGYTAYPTTFFAPTQVGQLNRLGLDIEVAYSQRLFKPYNSESVQSAFRNDRQIRLLFRSDTFEYASLIQDDALSSVLNEFNEMLSIIWLRTLLRGNWHYFLKALKSASVNGKYDVNVGVSGTVSLPMSIGCNDSRPLSVELDSGHTVFVPAIIWAEVRAVMPNATETDEFVIIAHNSPFLTINERNGLCKSMCHEVPWLRQSLFSKLQQYPMYGLAQCCRVADVQHKLDNFPKYVAPPKPPLPAPIEDLLANSI